MNTEHSGTTTTIDSKAIIGEHFGKLIVLSVFRDSYSHKKCRCRCECGRETEVYLCNLTSGRTRSCGCQGKISPNPPADVRGRRYGKLLALEPTEERDRGSVIWRCRCDCGNEVLVPLRRLNSGAATSCGCLPKRRGRAVKDLTGRRFGYLTVVGKSDERSYKGSVIWQCRCDCGNLVNLPSDSLLNGNARSCGCLRTETVKEARQGLHFVDGTCIEWLETRRQRSDNTSGHKGISRRKNGAYMAKIGFQGRQYYLGTYHTMEEAIAAREEAEEILFGTFLSRYHAWQEKGGGEDFEFDPGSMEEALHKMISRRNS